MHCNLARPPSQAAPAARASANASPWLAALTVVAPPDGGAEIPGAAIPLGTTTAYLWEENLPIWNAWVQVCTQWRTGMSGWESLDYTAVWTYLNAITRNPRKRRVWFECLAEMGRVCAEVLAEHRALERAAEAAKRDQKKHT